MPAARVRLIRHWALPASVLLHGGALGILLFSLVPPMISVPPAAESPIVVTVTTLASVAPQTAVVPPPMREPPTAIPEEPLPEPPLVKREEPLPLIDSTAAHEVAPPPPPPPAAKPPAPKPRPLPKPVQAPKPPQSALPHAPVEAVPPAPTSASPARRQALEAPAAPVVPPADYIGLIRAQLERNKVYPRAAQQRRQQGRAMLRVVIDRAGNVTRYELESSSGHEILDREVIAMIQRASPLPSIPSSLNTDRLEIVVPVDSFCAERPVASRWVGCARGGGAIGRAAASPTFPRPERKPRFAGGTLSVLVVPPRR